MNSTIKTVIAWVFILISALALWQVMKTANPGQKVQEINFSQFMSEVEKGTVKKVTLTGMEVKGTLADGSRFHSIIPANYPDMIKELQQKDVTITVQDVGNGSWGWLAPLALLALLVALWYAMLRAMLVHL
ncbi:MAG: ATP-dependent metallopeptidase FtsH/Yme1/Tma family protein, partial [Acidobacteria bacterium]|nr:ATP-dependent metallopeptidase FtsH/Yme1/Tma family protein [Acidobacteriota bacterium]